MFLSVIVPCYNVEKEILQRCILSVLNQEYMNYEILLIDDGSEESFRSEIRDIARLDERIKVITAIIKEIISITCSYDNFSLVETDTGSCMGKLLFSQIDEKSATVF